LDSRVQWAGSVTDERRIELFACCLGVLVPPIDEDYGYVTLEAMLAAKPVLTCTDSGGPLDFVLDGQTGFVCPPEAGLLAEKMDRLWRDRTQARSLGLSGREYYRTLGMDWNSVVGQLLA
jgi:glycosyltransferase involved in cell wall biosynthesis